MRDFKDESFISQFCRRKIMRDFRFFTVLDGDRNNYLGSRRFNERGLSQIRNKLSAQCQPPAILSRTSVWNVDLRGDRSDIFMCRTTASRWIKAGAKC